MAKLKPKARIIRTIGDQLISGPEAALIELVKNSYDADSPWVKIKIEPGEEEGKGGGISISDNGHGMTYLDVLEKWFEPATEHKKKNRYTLSGKRRMLGAKGIGRFASSRLGKKTALTSIAKKDDRTLEKTSLNINWEDFESNEYLEDMEIPINKEDVKCDTLSGNETGVSLHITDIRILWTKKKLENLVRELRRVASPINSDDEFKIYLDLSKFEYRESNKGSPTNFDGTSLLRDINTGALDDEEYAADEATLIRPYKLQNYADYMLSGEFDELGAFNGEFIIHKGDNIAQKIIIPAPPLDQEESHCGKIDIRINVYDREQASIEELFNRAGLDFKKMGIREARKILTNNSGIGIYRSGFRIRPYGEPDNDWLKLESRRVQDPSKKIGHAQISGQLHIDGEDESGLVERSSREGFEHNSSFERLKNLILSVLIRIEEKRFEFREKAGLSRKLDGDVEKAKSLASLNKISSAVLKLPIELQKPLLQKIENESQALTKSLEELEAYQKLLESRAALGTVVAQVIHDGRRLLEPMSDASKSIVGQIDHLWDETKKGEIIRKYYPIHAKTIGDGVKGLAALFKSLDPVSGRKRGRPLLFDVNEVFISSKNLLGDALIESNVEMYIDIPEKLIAYGYPGDMQAAVLNIIDNAIYWLSTIDSDEKVIHVNGRNINKKIQLSLSNNGPVIDDDFIPRLFHAGFSLKSDGHGLGLIIAREACRASKGDLYFDQDESDTTFVIEFPAEQ